MKLFTEKQLVEFGNYLLSDERRKLYESLSEECPTVEDAGSRLKSVSHTDVENFNSKQDADLCICIAGNMPVFNPDCKASKHKW